MTEASSRELHARDTRIIETREEIILIFGAASRESDEAGELLIDSAAQIILTPSAAKRFLEVLKDVFVRHESIHGVVNMPSKKEKRRELLARNKVSPVHSETISGSYSIIDRIDALGVHYGLEHSFKIFPSAVLADRVLIGFHCNELGGNAANELIQICRDLNMPDRFQKIYREHLGEANILLFGYEGNERGGIYKAYLEFGGMFETVVREFPEKPISFLLHLGFKWDADDNRKAALARYTCYPLLSVNDIIERLRDRFYAGKVRRTFEVVNSIVRRAARVMRSDEFLYLEVGEENNPRQSYDVNMYRANLTMEDIYPWIRDACRSYGISPESFHRIYDPIRHKIFGHVSGGFDREGREFLTFYYGVAGSTR